MSTDTTATNTLTNGWDATVGDDDTMLRRFVLHHATTAAAFAESLGGRSAIRDGYVVADTGRAAGFWNAVTLTRPPDDWTATVDAVLAEARDGVGDVLLWSPWPTPPLHHRGFALHGHPPLLVRPPSPCAGVTDLAEAHVIEEVLDEAVLVEWERIVVEGYPLPELQPFRAGSVAGAGLLADPRVRFWVGRDHGRAVSVGTSFASHGIASLACGVTRPGSRGHGHWRAHALTRLRAHPERWMTGIFSDHSRPLAEALGFVPITRFTLWAIPRPA